MPIKRTRPRSVTEGLWMSPEAAARKTAKTPLIANQRSPISQLSRSLEKPGTSSASALGALDSSRILRAWCLYRAKKSAELSPYCSKRSLRVAERSPSAHFGKVEAPPEPARVPRSEEHTSELQS